MISRTRIYALAKLHPRRTEALAVAIFFGLLAALFMGPILLHFGSAVHGFWGDGTGGIIWLNELKLPVFGGPTDAVIFPYGDNLFRPDFITGAAFVVPFWILANIFGAVAAWNLIVFGAFWLCGVSMYYLVKRLTASPLAALWAGVAFAYMPMHQYKAFGHIAYLLVFVFVFILWQLLNFLTNPSKKNAVLLGLISALSFYVDGYYVLFTLVLVGVPLLYTLGRALWRLSRKTAEDCKRLLLSLAVFAGTGVAALMPIIYFKLAYGAQIAAGLAMARGDFMSNVEVYTARWYDFVLPIETHPIFGAWVTSFRATHNHGSNTSEHTLYLGFVLLALVAWTAYFFWKHRADKKIKEVLVTRQTMIVLALVAIVALAISLQPFVHIFGFRIPMPSRILSEFVQYWRVYARLILIIDLVLVVIASVGLAVLIKRFKSRSAAVAVVAILIVVTVFEYLSFNPFKRQDIWYYNRLSSANQWLAQQKDVQVIAVYPLVDQPNGLASLYTTEQGIHDKKMINSGTISAKKTRLRAAIGGLNDPQTLPVLKALGVQAVMTHEINNDTQVSGLELLHQANDAPAGYAADVGIYKIAPSVIKARYALVPETGVKDVVGTNLRTKHFINSEGVVRLQVEAMPGVKDADTTKRTVSFVLGTTSAYKDNDVIITQGNTIVDAIHVDAKETKTKEYVIDTAKPLQLTVIGAFEKDSIFMQDLYVKN